MISGLTEQVRGYSLRMGFEADESAEAVIDPDTGEIIEPLN